MILNPWRSLRVARDQISSLRANLDQALDQNDVHTKAREALSREMAKRTQEVGQLRDQLRKRQEYGRDNVDLKQEISIRDTRIAAFRDESERVRKLCTCGATDEPPAPPDPWAIQWTPDVDDLHP